MSESTRVTHLPHSDKNIAYHMEWEFREQSVQWQNGIPVSVNFMPLGTILHNWMMQKGEMPLINKSNKTFYSEFSNPYTHNSLILTFTFTQIINDAYAFSKSIRLDNQVDVEIRCVRLYTEFVLYSARISEALIKQLLYCITFNENQYRRSALSSLLSKDCEGCKSSKQKRHKISMLGSLAHRYNLCQQFELCLNEHLKLVNRRRDVEAAHSGTTVFSLKPIPEIRSQFSEDMIKLGNEFVHMLKHIRSHPKTG